VNRGSGTMRDTVAVILAGGKGERLEPLTRDRAKPAVPFAGNYRIIDFALSNCLNSRIRKMLVLTQYKAMSLTRHIDLAWRQYLHRELNEFIDVVPPQQRIDEHWYQGTADAVYQNIYTLEKERPRHVIILAGDHIYKMNYREMIDYHQRVGADLTIGALVVDQEQARQFGVMQVNDHDRIIGFEEKPRDPKTIPGRSDRCLASMGIYVFSAGFLFEQLCQDATTRDSQHDFGRNIIPSIIQSHNVYAFPFVNEDGSQAYWKDVGTLDAYFEANMELLAQRPALNMYDPQWPIRTYQPNTPPPRFVSSGSEGARIEGRAVDSIACQGSMVIGGNVERSILSADVRVNPNAHIEDSILFDRVTVGSGAKIRRAIIDKGVRIPKGIEIGYDLEEDRRRGFTISPQGIVVIAKGDGIEHRFADTPASEYPQR
jgi:glucose-1-phosphate adenylyltransferase